MDLSFDTNRYFGTCTPLVQDLHLAAAKSASPAVEFVALLRTRYLPHTVGTNGIQGRDIQQPMGSSASLVSRGPVLLDLTSFDVTVGGCAVFLTRSEFDLLSYLVRASPRVVSQRELVEVVLQSAYRGDTSVVRVHISHLRKKLGDQCVIETVRSRGFRIR